MHCWYYHLCSNIYPPTSRRVGNGPSKNSIFMWLARSQSCVSHCLFMLFMLSMKVNSIVILNFHRVPKTSAAAIFSGDLYIFAKYAPVFSNRAFPTTFASHRHCHVRTYVQMRSFNFCSITSWECASTWTLLPHPTPPHPCVTHLQRSMTYVRTCKWTCRGVTSWECASTWTLLPHPTQPHPTPPLRDVTHLQRSMTYVRTCKWTCCGVTSWECASTWTLLPHPTPPQGTYIKMPKTLGRFSTRRHKHGKTIHIQKAKFCRSQAHMLHGASIYLQNWIFCSGKCWKIFQHHGAFGRTWYVDIIYIYIYII